MENLYKLNFSISYLFTGAILLVLGIIIYFKNSRNPLNITFSIYSLSIAWWSLFSIFMLNSKTEGAATFWDKVCLMGVVFIPATFIHFTITFLKSAENNKKIIQLCYGLSIFFFALNFTPYFIKETGSVYKLEYFTVPGPGYLVFIVYYSLAVIFGLFLLFRKFKHTRDGIYRQQLLYLFWGTLLGYSGGSLNYNLVFQFPPYELVPWGNYLIGIYGLMIAYAIVKYRLMDIRLVVTKIGIFSLVYSFVLSVPLWIGYKFLGYGPWLLPVMLMAVCATIGPIIFLFIQKKAEQTLLLEQRQYQSTLRRASLGMGRLKDLKHLLRMIVQIVTRTVRIEHGSIYLLHRDSGQYILKASKGRSVLPKVASVFSEDSVLIKYLKKVKQPVLYEEIQRKAQDFHVDEFYAVSAVMRQLGAELTVPCVIDNRMLAVVILGRKRSGKMYSHDDLVVFSILANQSAMAIENAIFYETAQKTTQQLFQAEKMATIGTMADGLSHQINNRLHAMGFVAGDALDSIQVLKKRGNLDSDIKDIVDDVEYALGRIQDNVKRGGEIVGGLLRYTRKGVEGLGPVALNELLDSSLEMAQFKIKMNTFEFQRNFDGSVPLILGNFTQLQEVFFNVIDNSYDAMMQRKADLNEKSYKPCLQVSVEMDMDTVRVTFRDNGIGVKVEDMGKMFTPFFTTKATAKKGTGLGMYVIRQIIEENHGGKVRFDSKYKSGSQTVMTLPRAVS